MTADGHHIAQPDPNGAGAARAMRLALAGADASAADVIHINAHATSTPQGDIAEATAIKSVLGTSVDDVAVSGTKSMTGHLLGAAGVIEAMASVLAVHHDLVPPTINHFTDDPGLDNKLNLTFWKAQQRTVRAALSNTFGFGGHNASVVVGRLRD